MKKQICSILLFLFLALALAPENTPLSGGITAEAAKTTVKQTAKKKVYKKTLRTVNGKVYYYNSKGKMVKNCWLTIKGKRYYFKSNGAAATGLNTIKGKRYLFSSNGVLKPKGLRIYGKYKYCVGENGLIKTGWQTIGKKKYYFYKTNGRMARDTWINNRYVDKNGVLDPKKKKPLPKLESKIRSAIRSYGGTWSVYVKNLDTGDAITINNQRIYAASLIKLYAMGAAYDRIRQKRLSESSVSGLLNDMITVSDNAAFNSIVKKIGTSYINTWCRANGFTGTNQGHGLSPAYNNSGLTNGSGSNVTTVADCGRLLEQIYRGTCVSKSASQKMLSLLKRQERRWKIPAGVPGSVIVANKTGETDDTTHDAAIVYSKGADYILVVMASTPGSGWYSAGHITELSRLVYDYFN